MANKKNYDKKHARADAGKIMASVSSTLVCIVLIAALCSSSAKGSFESYTPVDTDVNWQLTETTGAADTLPDASSDTTDIQTEVITDKEDTTNTPVTAPPVTEAETEPPEPPKTDGEMHIGGFDRDGVKLDITKVSKGDLNYFICDIKLSSPEQLKTAFAGGKLTGRLYTSKIAKSVGATFAVNGDFCGFRKEGIIIREGNLYRNKKAGWDLLYLDKNGELITCDNDSADGEELVSQGVIHSWCFGPTLVRDGKALSEFNTPGLSHRAREPRTAIGQVDKLHYIILVVDAVRTSTHTVGGMNFAELANEFERLGCKTAYNFDGGGSTTLYFNGQVINTPCVSGERAVSDIIYLK